MATNSIETVSRALEAGFAERGEKVVVWADRSVYKDFIRMYVVFRLLSGMSEKDRLGEIYSTLESYGAKAMIRKISLCVAMTKGEYDAEFGEGVWLGDLSKVYRETKPRPKLHRLTRAHSRN